MIDIQQVFQTLYRNNQQISLLQANNDQLLELLMQAGAVQAAAQVQQMMAPANSHRVDVELPQLPAPAKGGRPPLQRYDSLGRRIPTNKKPSPGRPKAGPRTGTTWSPEQREKHAATLAAKNSNRTAPYRAKMSRAMKAADARKKAEGAAFKSKKQLAQEAREAQA